MENTYTTRSNVDSESLHQLNQAVWWSRLFSYCRVRMGKWLRSKIKPENIDKSNRTVILLSRPVYDNSAVPFMLQLLLS